MYFFFFFFFFFGGGQFNFSITYSMSFQVLTYHKYFPCAVYGKEVTEEVEILSFESLQIFSSLL